MTVMTLVSRVLGLVREQVRGYFLGTGAASDAFGLATLIPNLLRRLLAEGAMTAAFVPVLVEYLERGKAALTREFLSKFVTFLTAVVVLVSLLGVLTTPWLIRTFFGEFGEVEGKIELTINLTQLMWPYLAFVSVAAVLQGILNARNIFGPSAFTPVLLNLSIILCGVGLSSFFPDPSYALVTGFLLGGAVQLFFQVPYLIRWTTIRFRFDLRMRHPGVRRVVLIMIPGIFAAGIYQINVFVSQLIASTLEGGSIAALQYGIRLQELVLGLFVVSVAQVILPTLAQHTARGDDEGVKDTLAYATGLMAFVTLPATVGLLMVGPDIVRLLFQFGEFDSRSTAMTVHALDFYALGLFAVAITRVYQQVFYAHKDLKTPTIVAGVTMIANIVMCLLFIGPLEHGGIALAGSASAAVNAVLLAWLLRRRLGALGAADTLGRIGRMTLATGAMAGFVWGVEQLLPGSAVDRRLLLGLWVLGVVLGAVLVYILACRMLGVDELDAVWRSLARRFRRKKR